MIFFFFYNKTNGFKSSLMFKKSVYVNNFKKKFFFKKKFHFKKNILTLKKVSVIPIKLYVLKFKKILKLLKKKKFKFFCNLNVNFIRSEKSKNTRMGSGKGKTKQNFIRPTSTIFGWFSALTKNQFSKVKFIFKNFV